MANEILKNDIAAVIKTNGNNEITGALLQSALFQMINDLGKGGQYYGLLTPTATPETSDNNIFYITTTPGTYTNFGSVVINVGELAIIKRLNNIWYKDKIDLSNVAIENFMIDLMHFPTTAGYLNPSGSFVGGDPNYLTTDYFPVQKGDRIIVNLFTQSATSTIVLYDANKTIVSTFIPSNSTPGYNTFDVTIPDNVVYGRICYWKNKENNSAIVYKQLSLISDLQLQVSDLQLQVDENTTDILELQTTVAEILEQLPNDNLWRFATQVGFVNLTGGVNNSDVNWKRSDFIAFEENKQIKFHLYGAYNMNCYSFYDENKTFISGGGYNRVSGSGLFEATITSPANTKFVKVSGGAETYTPAIPFMPFSANVSTDLSDINERIDTLDNEVAELQSDVELLKEYKAVTDYWDNYVTIMGYINKSGVLTAQTDVNWQSSDFINIGAGIDVDIRSYGHTLVNTVSFYDENKTFISGIGATVIGTFEQIVISPANTKYMRLSGGAQTYSVAQASKPFRAIVTIAILDKIDDLQQQINDIDVVNEVPVNRKQVKIIVDSNSKIILYGDSISSTDYTWYKTAMEQLTGATVYNGGFSGQSTANLAKNAQLQRIFDYNPNIIVALVGGNDTGAANSVGSFIGLNNEPVVSETDINVDYNGTYYIQAVSHIIRKIKAQYYNIRERANLTGNETEAEKAAKIDAVLKPYFVFCTTLAQKRVDANNAFSNPENWKRKKDAIIECCEKYNVHCIDFFGLLDWDMSLEPYWISPTNMTNNRGIYTMDGLHPNKYGYQQMASLLCGELGII